MTNKVMSVIYDAVNNKLYVVWRYTAERLVITLPTQFVYIGEL
jgi:hypothetical protein